MALSFATCGPSHLHPTPPSSPLSQTINLEVSYSLTVTCQRSLLSSHSLWNQNRVETDLGSSWTRDLASKPISSLARQGSRWPQPGQAMVASCRGQDLASKCGDTRDRPAVLVFVQSGLRHVPICPPPNLMESP